MSNLYGLTLLCLIIWQNNLPLNARTVLCDQCPLMAVEMCWKLKCNGFICPAVSQLHTQTVTVHSSHETLLQSATYLRLPPGPVFNLSVPLSVSLCWFSFFLTLYFYFLPYLSLPARHPSLSHFNVFYQLSTLVLPITHPFLIFLLSPPSGTPEEQQRCGWMSSKTSTTQLSHLREMCPTESKYQYDGPNRVQIIAAKSENSRMKWA